MTKSRKVGDVQTDSFIKEHKKSLRESIRTRPKATDDGIRITVCCPERAMRLAQALNCGKNIPAIARKQLPETFTAIIATVSKPTNLLTGNDMNKMHVVSIKIIK